MILEEEKKIEVNEDINQSSLNTDTYVEKKSITHILLLFFVFLISFLCLITAVFIGFSYFNYKNNSYISNGVFINNIDMSKLTKSEAKEKLEQFYNDKLSNDITLVSGDYITYLKSSEIDLTYDIDSAIDYAYQIGKNNNIFINNFAIFNTLLNGINITPKYNYNSEKLTNILNDYSKELPDAIVEGSYYIEKNKLIITKGSDGKVVDVKNSISEIENKLTNLQFLNDTVELKTSQKSPQKIDLNKIYNEIHKEPKDAFFNYETHVVSPSENGLDFNISISEASSLLESSENECTIPLKVVYPKVTTNMIGDEAFPDLLASFSTKYATSNTNRTTNLRLAAEKINGYVLVPGNTFSYNSVVGERTIAAGYKEAAVYENGAVVQGLGGGICQISTTLFNAALFANLDIVEIHNHQFVPSYVGAGRDATVVYGVKDFKFKNSRKYAIKITCSVSGGIAKFNIWGLKEETEYDIKVNANITSSSSTYKKSATYRTKSLNGKVVTNEHIYNATYKVH